MDMFEVLCMSAVFVRIVYICGWVDAYVCLSLFLCVRRTFSTHLSYSFVEDIDGFFCTKGEIARIIANNTRINVPSSNRYVLR